jgi:hypothetical protein
MWRSGDVLAPRRILNYACKCFVTGNSTEAR